MSSKNYSQNPPTSSVSTGSRRSNRPQSNKPAPLGHVEIPSHRHPGKGMKEIHEQQKQLVPLGSQSLPLSSQTAQSKTTTPAETTLIYYQAQDTADNMSNSVKSEKTLISKQKKKKQKQISFEGYARVFFSGQCDKQERQILPSSETAGSDDSHLYITIDTTKHTLNLYPASPFEYSPTVFFDDAHDFTDNNEERDTIRPIVDPPIELSYFVAEPIVGSVCGVYLYVRKDYDRYYSNTPCSEHHNSSNSKLKYTFRFEFRNETTMQTQVRAQNVYNASQRANKTSRETALKNMETGVTNIFSKYDDIESAKRMEERKVQDTYGVYLREVEGLCKEVASLTRKFVRMANARTILIHNENNVEQKVKVSSQQTPKRSNRADMVNKVSSGGNNVGQSYGYDYSSDGDSSTDGEFQGQHQLVLPQNQYVAQSRPRGLSF